MYLSPLGIVFFFRPVEESIILVAIEKKKMVRVHTAQEREKGRPIK